MQPHTARKQRAVLLKEYFTLYDFEPEEAFAGSIDVMETGRY